jgi:ABC-type glycerol-3-phosphate transport system permease component
MTTPMSTHDKPSPLTRAALHLVLGVIALLTLVPFAWLVVSSLKSRDDFFSAVFFPPGDGVFGVAWDRLTLDNYRNLLPLGFLRAFLNSLFYAGTTAAVATLVAAAAGYALAKHRFRGKRAVELLVVALVILPPSLLIAPGYALLHDLRLLDTVPGLLLPFLGPAFGVYLFRQSISQAVPDQLIESARLDGCTELEVFLAIVLPLVRPMIGAFLLITFLGVWNNFISPQLVLQSPEAQPLSVAIAQLRGLYRTDYGLLMAGTVVSVAPVALLFLALQRQFIAGLTAGAVKG